MDEEAPERFGGLPVISRVTLTLEEPPLLLAKTVYCVEGDVTVGVPEIKPVVVLNVIPAGREG